MRRYCCPRTYFYPRPPRGGRPGIRPALSALRYFYPRPPRGGRPLYGAARQGVRGISIHALREEGDLPQWSQNSLFIFEFLSTPSARRATDIRTELDPAGKFLSTPSARRATLFLTKNPSRYMISIHALREEGDAPRGISCTRRCQFLSTPSARRATASGDRLHP